MRIWIELDTKNTSNLEESVEMFQLSKEEETSGSTERKRPSPPRGSQTCLILTSHVSSDTSTIFMIVIL